MTGSLSGKRGSYNDCGGIPVMGLYDSADFAYGLLSGYSIEV